MNPLHCITSSTYPLHIWIPLGVTPRVVVLWFVITPLNRTRISLQPPLPGNPPYYRFPSPIVTTNQPYHQLPLRWIATMFQYNTASYQCPFETALRRSVEWFSLHYIVCIIIDISLSFTDSYIISWPPHHFLVNTPRSLI